MPDQETNKEADGNANGGQPRPPQRGLDCGLLPWVRCFGTKNDLDEHKAYKPYGGHDGE